MKYTDFDSAYQAWIDILQQIYDYKVPEKNQVIREWANELLMLCKANKIKVTQDDLDTLKAEGRLTNKTFVKLCKVDKPIYDELYAKFSERTLADINELYSHETAPRIAMYYLRHTKPIKDFYADSMTIVEVYDVGNYNDGNSNNNSCRKMVTKLKDLGFQVEIKQCSWDYNFGSRSCHMCYKAIYANVNDVVKMLMATKDDIPFDIFKDDCDLWTINTKEQHLIQSWYNKPYLGFSHYLFDTDYQPPANNLNFEVKTI